MSDPIEPIDPRTLPLEPVECSLGTWTHSDVDEHGNVYLIATPGGAVQAIRANGDLSVENIEADIASPAVPPAGPRELSRLVLKERLDELGKWAAFKSMAQSAGFWDDFVLSSFVSTDHPLFTIHAPTVKAALKLTDQQFATLTS